jgi:hypothetical protein
MRYCGADSRAMVGTKVEFPGSPALMKPLNQKCWLTFREFPLTEALLTSVDEERGLLKLDSYFVVPKTFDLFLTYNCTVGRRCRVLEQSGVMLAVEFTGRIGSGLRADNDNIMLV